MIRTLTSVLGLLGCAPPPSAPPAQHGAPISAPPPSSGVAANSQPDGGLASSGPAEPADGRAWRTAYDWDGDGKNDEVVSEFSGGAHCCYRVGVRLTSTQAVVMLPFHLDGGYVGSEDLPSLPERFSIRTTPGAPPEMILEIETYDGAPQPLDPAWQKSYGISSHRVAVSFSGGRVRVRDAGEAAPR